MSQATGRARSAFAALSLVLCLSLPALACSWDSDTLRDEARGLPEAVDILTGRFERNPALYYEMRLKRVAAELERDPTRLADYDDAGVACDRLHRGDEAIEWMVKKKQQLDKLGPAPVPAKAGDPPMKLGSIAGHWYRYHANLGTFHAHRWVRGQRDREQMEDMKIGRELIAKAIAINPDAHFGREKYQLAAMDWIIAAPTGSRSGLHAQAFMENDQSDPKQATRGLLGLIVLGDAWRSVDVHAALGMQFQQEGLSTLAYLANLRLFEIIDTGGRSIHPKAPGSPGADKSKFSEVEDRELLKSWVRSTRTIEGTTSHGDVLDRFFGEARAAADRWAASREAFMLAKLNAGKHPDTDKDFWTGYTEEPPLPLPAMGVVEAAVKGWEDNVFLISGIVLGAMALVIGVVIRKKRSGRAPGWEGQ